MKGTTTAAATNHETRGATRRYLSPISTLPYELDDVHEKCHCRRTRGCELQGGGSCSVTPPGSPVDGCVRRKQLKACQLCRPSNSPSAMRFSFVCFPNMFERGGRLYGSMSLRVSTINNLAVGRKGARPQGRHHHIPRLLVRQVACPRPVLTKQKRAKASHGEPLMAYQRLFSGSQLPCRSAQALFPIEIRQPPTHPGQSVSAAPVCL